MQEIPWAQIRRRIVIAGGGLAGLSLALALKRTLGPAIDVFMFDPALRRDPKGDPRAYAIAAAARRMLVTLGVWPLVEAKAQPILDMMITDSRLHDPVRPTFLTFAGEIEPGEPFAHMVEGRDLTSAMVEACAEAGVELRPVSVQGFRIEDDRIEAQIEGAAASPCGAFSLLRMAARSRLRDQAGIGWIEWPYRQSGIVATIAHERDHAGRAVEHFLPSGPFAILPLRPGGSLGHRSSIVWTERSENVPYLLGLAPEDLLAELEQRFGLELGRLAIRDEAAGPSPLIRCRAELRLRADRAFRRCRPPDPPDRRPGAQSRHA